MLPTGKLLEFSPRKAADIPADAVPAVMAQPSTGLRNWFNNQSIRLKLNTIAVVYVSIILSLLAVVTFALNTDTGMRAYVQGEGLWSKGQKDAVYYLTRYADLQDESDYHKYLRAIAVPLGDRAARLELQKSAFDYEVAERGFIAGANAPQDMPYMISLFRRFHDFSYMATAIAIWSEADLHIAQLVETGDKIHAAVVGGHLTEARKSELISRIEQINANVTPIEYRFSSTLGEAARWMRELLLTSIFVFAVVLLAGGLTISTWISRQLRRRLMILRAGTLRVADGDLNLQMPVSTHDEIGDLTRAFNDMIVHRRQVEQRMEHTLSVLAATLESTTDGILVVDHERRIVNYNQRFVEMWNIRKDIIQLNDDDIALNYILSQVEDTNGFIANTRDYYAHIAQESYDVLRLKDGRVFERYSQPHRIENDVIGRVWSFRDITERTRGEAEITQHRDFETLITRLSTGMISQAPKQLDEGVNRALGELGRFTQIDRAYVFEFDDHRICVNCTYEWCGENITPQIDQLQNLPVVNFPWVEACLLRGEVVHVPRVSDLPPAAAAERTAWQAESIQSLVLVPLFLSGSVVGYTAFHAVRNEKSWSPETIALLKIFGEMVVNVQQRKRADLALQAQAEARALAEVHIHQLAHHDTLTKLPNRTLLMDRLDMALERARRGNTQVAVMMLDLDHFKNINDSLGHSIGDQLLQTVATRLSRCARKTDTVARMGGDEFVIVLADVHDRSIIERVSLAITNAVSTPIVIDSHELVHTASIGISVFPADGADASTLLKRADTAMYQAKAQGRGNYQWFAPSMMLAADERLELQSALQRALDRKEFSLYFQPLVSIRTGKVVGSESLLRWRHPRRGVLSPATFILLAEETGLIVPIGTWVLRQACIEGKKMQDRLGMPLTISVNISTRQFRQDNLLQIVKDALAQSGLPTHTLVLEITESVLAANPQETAAVLRKIRELGVRIAVDDFGTGYSSLSYITRFPIDVLKIDASFVRDVIVDQNDAAITSAIIALAQNLKLETVAEGVETPAQLAFLRQRFCDEAQGYHFGQPVPITEFPALVSRINKAAAQNKVCH